MKIILLCTTLALNIFLYGCDLSDEQGIRDSREDFMRELENALTENDIPFSVDDEGYIRYPGTHKEAVAEIKHQLDKQRANEVGSKYEDEQSTKYFRKLLDENGLSYRVVSLEGKEWTYWTPESKEQQHEIEMKVVTHAFERQK